MFLKPQNILNELRNNKIITPSMKGADFGCGSGYFTALLANEVGQNGLIYAIDIQEDVLKEAQEFLKNLNINNVRFILADLEENSQLESETLDFVFISQLLFQVENVERIFFEAKRVLKKNGYLIIVEPLRDNYLFREYKVLSENNIESYLNENGFKIILMKKFSGYFLSVSQK
ncbi:MAG: hypothetical protein KatS3mg097_374 [Candidatus Parcubacteria bacterium]|nr:MAG: hypothetical protein KatS3mg097_374 [Candidatus Parcubacteria bacterium]